MRSYWLNGLFKLCHRTVRFGYIGQLHGFACISIGEKTCFGDNLYLTAWPELCTSGKEPNLSIGSNCSFGAYNHITCANRVTIGDSLLTGKWVTITDNSHGETDKPTLGMCCGCAYDWAWLRGGILLSLQTMPTTCMPI